MSLRQAATFEGHFSPLVFRYDYCFVRLFISEFREWQEYPAPALPGGGGGQGFRGPQTGRSHSCPPSRVHPAHRIAVDPS